MQAAMGWPWFSHWLFALQLEFLPKGEGKTQTQCSWSMQAGFLGFLVTYRFAVMQLNVKWKGNLEETHEPHIRDHSTAIPRGHRRFSVTNSISQSSLTHTCHLFFILTWMTLSTLLTLSFSCVSYVKRYNIWIRFSLIHTFRITSICTDRWVKSILV